jgi:hypothetical protein
MGMRLGESALSSDFVACFCLLVCLLELLQIFLRAALGKGSQWSEAGMVKGPNNGAVE